MLTAEQKARVLGTMGVQPKEDSWEDDWKQAAGLKTNKQVVEEIETEPRKEGFISNVFGDIKKRLGGIKDTALALKEGEITSPEAGLRVAGEVAGGIGDVVGQGLVSGFKMLTPKAVENKLSSLGTDFLSSSSGKDLIGAISSGVDSYNQWKTKHPRLAENVEALGNVASMLPIGKGAQVGKEVIETGLEQVGKTAVGKAVGETIESGAKKVGTAVKEVGEKIKPTETLQDVTGKIIQGETEDVKQGIKALSNIDLGSVKTYKDLSTKFKEAIPNISRQVDTVLDSISQTPKKLDELKTSITSKAGKVLETNYVKQALTHLSELYDVTGDILKKADIEDLIEQSTKQGLTLKEINNIARQYGSEFGQKAFSKTGDPLTSVNAKLFENIRSGVKEVARQGLKGTEAEGLDDVLTAMYNTKKLVEKNVEAVNKLAQKIQKRGLLEKIGVGAVKTVDTLSGGFLRGLMGGLLPRGVGNKVMNALDLEDILQKNLKKFEKLLKSGSDEEIEKALTDLLPKAKAVAETAGTKTATNTVKADDFLIQEAKKYKSAEEFVKAQGETVYRGGLDLSQEKITESGISVSKSKNIAEDFVKQKGGKVEEMLISPNAKIANYSDIQNVKFKNLNDYSPELDTGNKQIWQDLEGEYQKAVDWAKENGYDAVKLPLEGETRIINPNVLKTKSQLTDMWKKAHGKSNAVTSAEQKVVKGLDVSKIEFAKGLSNTDKIIEKKAIDKIKNSGNEILENYFAKHGKEVNADNFRPFFKDVGYKGDNAAAVQEPSSFLAKKAWTEALKNPEPEALFTSGMSGAGKSSALKNIPEYEAFKKEAAGVLDSNLSNYDSAIKKINEAIDAGKTPRVFYTYRELLDGFVNGVVKRMKENPDEMGRLVPTKVIAENAPGSWEVAKRLKNEGLDVYFIDNSLGAGNAKLVTMKDLERKIKYSSDLNKILKDKAKELYEKGTITKKQYEGYIE